MFKTRERPVANKIRVIRAIRVRLKDRDPCAYKIQSKKLFVSFGLFVFKKSRVQAPRERPAANNVRAIRVRIKNRVKSACKKLFVSFGLFVFKNIVFKPL